MTIFWYHHFSLSVEPVPMDAFGTFRLDTSLIISNPIQMRPTCRIVALFTIHTFTFATTGSSNSGYLETANVIN